MIGFDTNILVRHLTGDHEDQSPRARRLLLDELTSAEPGYVNLVVLVELGWVLRTSYKHAPAQIAGAMEGLVRLRSLIVEEAVLVLRAAGLVRQRKVDFGEALIAVLNAARRCEKTLTFDRDALRLPEFAPL